MLDVKATEDMLALVQKMIAIPSFTGEESELVHFLHGYMEAVGYDDVRIDEYGNVLGVIHGDHEGPRILFDGHVDTVGIGDESSWRVPPFSGTIVDGKLYGRGTSDMKGALGAMIYAAKDIDRENLYGSIYISGTVNEEVAEGAALLKILDEVHPHLVVIGESSSLKLNTGQRGRAEIFLRTMGRRAHSANPQIGINAVKKMMQVLAALDAYQPRQDAKLGEALMEITDIMSWPYPGASVVPEQCEVTVDRRLVRGDTPSRVLDEIKALLSGMDDPELQVQVGIRDNDVETWSGLHLDTLRYAPPWYFPFEEDWIQDIQQLLERNGLVTEFGTYSFCTNGSASAGERDIPTIGFGPGDETKAHTVDEWISVDSLQKGCWGYRVLMQNLGKERKL